jgi:hypothetical protein
MYFVSHVGYTLEHEVDKALSEVLAGVPASSPAREALHRLCNLVVPALSHADLATEKKHGLINVFRLLKVLFERMTEHELIKAHFWVIWVVRSSRYLRHRKLADRVQLVTHLHGSAWTTGHQQGASSDGDSSRGAVVDSY